MIETGGDHLRETVTIYARGNAGERGGASYFVGDHMLFRENGRGQSSPTQYKGGAKGN